MSQTTGTRRNGHASVCDAPGVAATSALAVGRTQEGGVPASASGAASVTGSSAVPSVVAGQGCQC